MNTVDKEQFQEFVANFVKTSTGDVLVSAI